MIYSAIKSDPTRTFSLFFALLFFFSWNLSSPSFVHNLPALLFIRPDLALAQQQKYVFDLH